MKKSIVLLLCALTGFAATAQTDNKQGLLDECQRLYSDGEYTTAMSLLEKIDQENLSNRDKQEFELLKALTTYENDVLDGRAMIFQYLTDYPESAKRELLNCYIAQSYYYTGNYDQACKWFEQSDLKRLTPAQRDKGTLLYALSLLNCGNNGAAESLLTGLSTASKRCGKDAEFYLAVINYNRGNLDEAYKGFKKFELDEKYCGESQYYITGIWLKRGEATRAADGARMYLDGNKPTAAEYYRMYQMLGASEFIQGNYEEAAKALTTYIENYPNPQRVAIYQLGVSLYETGEYDAAMEKLLLCTEEEDATAQSSLLYIGLIHLENGNDNSARLTLEQASTMTYDKDVREEALYNYALCIHQTRYSPFAESVKAFELFLNDYPNSRHADKVGEYLVEVYNNTRNYDIALQSINKIKKPSDKILEAKQNILYRLGIQEFVNGNMEGAIEYMNSSLKLAKYNANTQSNALFWKGEALMRKNDIKGARNSYIQSMKTGAAGNSLALYGLGYTYFNERRYNEARNEFERYVKAADKKDAEIISDAYNRIADCHFYQRKFDTAGSYYSKAANTYNKNADYSLYRFAQIQSLKNNQAESLNTLKTLTSKFPGSPYTEQALYEMGRNYIKQEKYNDAIKTYNKLIAGFPNSATSRRALAERAMIYNTIGDRENAIDAYKEIISKYPQSEEAKIAMQDLKSIYVDMGSVDQYAQYAANTAGMQPIESSEIDTLTYIAAEKAYGRGNLDEAEKAFDNYLRNYPAGAFRLNSYYYKGVICYNRGKKDEAVENFAKVLEYPGNQYREEAMVVAAGIYYDNKEYNKAGELYKELATVSSNEERCKTALSRVLHISIEQKKHDDVIEYATTIENHPNVSPEQKREAIFSRAKAYIETDERDKALEDLDLLAQDTRTKEGAEAKYLVAQMLFEDESYDFCEDEINEFIEKSTPHTYWMARSFILLADLYTIQGKTLEAKQYLLSLQNNYEGDDDIAEIIAKRLEKLSATENKQQ
ncbi:MAG: tetratricopeptide repeat protein [Bacteroidaceae bacterium]|nr:tetratricopeptide repeat protein [Bacteroidaceae bacterium]